MSLDHLLNQELKLTATEVSIYDIYCGPNSNGIYNSTNPSYAHYKFKLRSCIADSYGYYYLTIIKTNEEIIPINLLNRELRLTANEINLYSIYCGPNGSWSTNNGIYYSDDPLYYSYKFKLRSCLADVYGYYYVTIMKINNYTNNDLYIINPSLLGNVIYSNNYVANRGEKKHTCSICHEKLINVCTGCSQYGYHKHKSIHIPKDKQHWIDKGNWTRMYQPNPYAILDPSNCGVLIGSCGHAYHYHCRQMDGFIFNRRNCPECNKLFDNLVFIESSFSDKKWRVKNYAKYLKYIKYNKTEKINEINKLTNKIMSTKWFLELNKKYY
jgi:hypothetical protein